jgi:hypothetical protein
MTEGFLNDSPEVSCRDGEFKSNMLHLKTPPHRDKGADIELF